MRSTKGRLTYAASPKHKTNLKGDGSETHYRIEIFVPFVERALSQMAARFTDHNRKALSLELLLPKLSGQEGVHGNLEEVFDFYMNYCFLHSPSSKLWEKMSCGAAYGRRKIG